MSYESRPRPTRSYGGGPDSGGFGGQPMGGHSAPVDSGAPPVDAVVKWFKADKGYGFVELAGGQGDAFLHANALHAAGHDTVPSGAKLRVQVGAGAKGAQVTRVLEVDASGVVEQRPQRSSSEGPRPRRVAPDPSTAVSVTGKVKWFDDAKGFGFVASEDGGKDVFVHISILGPSGISHLAEGQQVTMRVVDTPKGREAISLSL
jgi:CspA family cold shock protein